MSFLAKVLNNFTTKFPSPQRPPSALAKSDRRRRSGLVTFPQHSGHQSPWNNKKTTAIVPSAGAAGGGPPDDDDGSSSSSDDAEHCPSPPPPQRPQKYPKEDKDKRAKKKKGKKHHKRRSPSPSPSPSGSDTSSDSSDSDDDNSRRRSRHHRRRRSGSPAKAPGRPIPTFNGTEPEADTWVFMLENAAENTRLSDRATCTTAISCLTGKAAKWLKITTEGSKPFRKWEGGTGLKRAILKRFAKAYSEADTTAAYGKLHQRSDESVEDFYDRVNAAVTMKIRSLQESSHATKKEVRKWEIMHVLRAGLLPHIRAHIHNVRPAPSTVLDLMDLAVTFEESQKHRTHNNSNDQKENKGKGKSSNKNKSSSKNNSAVAAPIVCYNCDQEGHISRHCPKRKQKGQKSKGQPPRRRSSSNNQRQNSRSRNPGRPATPPHATDDPPAYAAQVSRQVTQPAAAQMAPVTTQLPPLMSVTTHRQTEPWAEDF